MRYNYYKEEHQLVFQEVFKHQLVIITGNTEHWSIIWCQKNISPNKLEVDVNYERLNGPKDIILIISTHKQFTDLNWSCCCWSAPCPKSRPNLQYRCRKTRNLGSIYYVYGVYIYRQGLLMGIQWDQRFHLSLVRP